LYCFILAFLGLTVAGSPTLAQTLDLSRFRLVFEEDFKNLSVSSHGPNTTWIAHTPWGGDFGDAAFADPAAGFPFSHTDGVFHIELRRDAGGRWQSGLLASQDATGHGFAQRFGYFEMRAKLPAGPGVWPAFWLDSLTPPGSSDPSLEVDIIEQYGKFPDHYNSTIILWPKTPDTRQRSAAKIHTVPYGSMSADFHTYGADVEPEWTVFYFDRVEKWRVKTPTEHTHDLMILVDLGLGSGWPIDKTPSPSFMYIDYIRAYTLR
jgi:beta-glucanase (GH16 family)